MLIDKEYLEKLLNSGFKPDEISVLLGYEKVDEFHKAVKKQFKMDIWSFMVIIDPEQGKLMAVDEEILRQRLAMLNEHKEEGKRTDKLWADIIEMAQTQMNHSEIVDYTMMEEEKLDELCQKKHNMSIVDFIYHYQLDGQRMLLKEQAGIKNDKMLIHRGKSYIAQQQEKKSDINVNIDNRQVRAVLPAPIKKTNYIEVKEVKEEPKALTNDNSGTSPNNT